jgi:hypothetical protein
MRHLRLTILLPWLCAAIPNTPPPPIELTPSEQAQLAAREIVVRFDTGDTGGGALGVVDLTSSVTRTWDALMDLQARVGEISGLRAMEYTVKEPRRLGARWELKVFTATIVFHTLYDLVPEQGWVRYSLDGTRTPNDLVSVEGAYQISEVPGGSRLVYRSEMDSGRSVPGFVKRWLAVDALTEQLTGIRARAER